MDNSLVPIIFGMAAVTYGPRLAPFLFMKNIKLSPFWDNFLKCIPVAAIGALIFPGVLNATPDYPIAGIIGLLFTLIYGLIRGGIILPVLGSVAVAYGFIFFF